MNKKILSIFALIMAISILGVSCSENPADPNNGGSGNPNLPTAQYPQTDLTKTQVAEIVKKLGTVTVNTAEANKTVEFALGSEAMDTDPILGAYAANGVAMAATSSAEPTKATVIGINDVLNAFNTIIKGAEYQQAVKDAIKDADDKSLITKVNDATIHFADGVEIVLAITFVDSENKNGVIALPLTITSGAVSGVAVDFGESTKEMPKVTADNIKTAIKTVFSNMKIGTDQNEVIVKELADGDITLENDSSKLKIAITTGIDPQSKTVGATELKAVLDGGGAYATLQSELSKFGVSIGDYVAAGVAKDNSDGKNLYIDSTNPAASRTGINVTRAAGSGYQLDTTVIHGSKLYIALVATTTDWQN